MKGLSICPIFFAQGLCLLTCHVIRRTQSQPDICLKHMTALENIFCTAVVRHTLPTKLMQLTLKSVREINDLSMEDGLHFLERRIRVLFANGPPQYSAQTALLDATTMMTLKLVLRRCSCSPWFISPYAPRWICWLGSWRAVSRQSSRLSSGRTFKTALCPVSSWFCSRRWYYDCSWR